MIFLNSSCYFCPFTLSSRSLSRGGFFYRLFTLSADRYLFEIMLGCHVSLERNFQSDVKNSLATGCRYRSSTRITTFTTGSNDYKNQPSSNASPSNQRYPASNLDRLAESPGNATKENNCLPAFGRLCPHQCQRSMTKATNLNN